MTGPTDLLQVPTMVPGFDYDLWLLGNYATNNPPTLATVNPVPFVRSDAPPFRIIHGEADPNMNILASQLLHSALTNAGVSSTFIRLPGVGHTIPASQDAPAAQWLADTFNASSNFSLTISNHSFEFPAIPADSFNVASAPPGWVSYGSINNNNRSVGVLDPAGSTLYAVPPPHGENVGITFLLDNPGNQTFFANSEAGLRQTLAATLQTKRRYTLRVEVGNIANDVNATFAFTGFPNYRIDLMVGTNVLASDNNTLLPGEGLFLTSTVAVNVAASNPFGGQALGVRLVNLNSAPGIEVNWDNVRLEHGPIPSPTLSVTRSGNSLQLAWPASANAFALQIATNFTSPVNWQPAGLAVIQSNGQFRATASSNATGRYFRLQAQ